MDVELDETRDGSCKQPPFLVQRGLIRGAQSTRALLRDANPVSEQDVARATIFKL
jgi:hypothetical protein